MTNGEDSAPVDTNDDHPNRLQKVYQPPTPHPGYPNYGFNTQNPPTNLWGPFTGANIAAMAYGQQIPDSVVITDNFSDGISLASTISMSMPHSGSIATVASHNNQMHMTPSAAPSIPNNVSYVCRSQPTLQLHCIIYSHLIIFLCSTP